MSTPATATMSIPQNHQYYGYKTHQYLPPINTEYHPQSPFQQPPHSATPNHVRRPHYSTSNYTTLPQSTSIQYASGHGSETYHHEARQMPAHSLQPSSPHTAQPIPRKRQKERVDWNEYFGKGLPSEIIVIEDSDDEKGKPNRQPPPQPKQSHYPDQQQQYQALDPTHTDKRRKLAPSMTQVPAYQSSTTTSYAQSPSNRASGVTTAPTSLGSTSSGQMPHEPAPGQKRKRTGRQPAEPEPRLGNPYNDYHAPPNPPYKADNVTVPIIEEEKPRYKNAPVPIYDDDDGHYLIKAKSMLTSRYIIESLLGQGTFGRVVKAYDRKRDRWVAIKIIRAVQKYREASKIELKVLATLAHNDRLNYNKCIHLRDTFDFRNHICIVTDLLGQSVFDFLKNNEFVPFPSSHIQSFARQLFTSVAFLHDLNLIHTDLKPENILLVNSNYQTFTYNRNIPSSSSLTNRTAKYRRVLLEPEIRLIDFGSATFEEDYHSSVVSTRHYRAPEIYLNLGWSFPCDIWSIGCILVEFFTGDALFQTHEDLEHLAMMEAVCGKEIDRAIIRAVTGGRANKNSAASFFKRQALDYPRPDTAKQSRKFVKAMKQFDEFIPAHTSAFNRQFLDLLRRIFVYDPRKRITAKQALQHPWFQEHYEDDGTEAMRIRRERQRQDAEKQQAEQAQQAQQRA